MTLTIVYDDRCAFCRRCRDWLLTQPLHVPTSLVGCDDPTTRRRYGHLPGYGHELLVLADDGRVWAGPAAFTVALWATRRFRHLAHHTTGPAARFLLAAVSANRDRLGRLVGTDCGNDECR